MPKKSKSKFRHHKKHVTHALPPACTREDVDYAESIGFTKINGKEEFILLYKDGK